MAKAVVCVEDHCTGIPIHVCASGSEDVFVSGRSVCRKGDILTIGETLTQGSTKVFVNGHGIARAGDMASCSFYLVSKNSNVFAE